VTIVAPSTSQIKIFFMQAPPKHGGSTPCDPVFTAGVPLGPALDFFPGRVLAAAKADGLQPAAQDGMTIDHILYCLGSVLACLLSYNIVDK
jgi:hypothetical protein